MALAYVERNLLRAGLVAAAEEYRWSTADPHSRQDDMDGLLDCEQWDARYSGER